MAVYGKGWAYHPRNRAASQGLETKICTEPTVTELRESAGD